MIIIPCCAKKSTIAEGARTRALAFEKELGHYRDALMVSLTDNPNLWTFHCKREKQAPPKNQYLPQRNSTKVLPALFRYIGRLYAELSDEAKRKTLDPVGPVYILSALYGLIQPTDEIADYDLMMTDTCEDPVCLSAFPPGAAHSVWGLWKSAFSASAISFGDPEFVLGFVSDKYNEVAHSLVCSKTRRKDYNQVKVVDGNSSETSPLRGRFLSAGLRELSRHGMAEWTALASDPRFPRIKIVRLPCR